MSQSRTDGQTELVVQDKRSVSLSQVQDTAPQDPIMALMSKFASNDAISPEKAKMLLDIYVDGQRRMQEMQDERAFAEAMADFKKSPPRIVKDREARMKGVAKGSGREYEMSYRYADLEAYAEAIMPELARRGITWSFLHREDGNKISVSCILRYGIYERKGDPLSSSPDSTGNKNEIQQKGSTLSYLERYTLCAATGMVAAMPDKDANKEDGEDAAMDENAVIDFIESIKDSSTPEELKKNFQAAISAAENAGDKRAITSFNQAKNDTWRKKGFRA